MIIVSRGISNTFAFIVLLYFTYFTYLLRQGRLQGPGAPMHRSGATESLKGAVQGDQDPTDALVAKYNQAPGKMRWKWYDKYWQYWWSIGTY